MYPERRIAHNWLVYRISNAMIRQRLPCLCGTILDVDCGERPFEKDILNYADWYVGVDWSNTLHNLKVDVVADANRPLPFRNDMFDNVLSFEVLEHLAEPDVMLCEAFRVLKCGGELTLSVPFQWWLHEAPWDYQRFTSHGLEYHLRKAGFEQTNIAPRSGFWVMWVLKFNYQTLRLVRGPKFVRRAIRVLLIPMWWCNQAVAPWLDRIWPEPNETAGYFVTARKP